MSGPTDAEADREAPAGSDGDGGDGDSDVGGDAAGVDRESDPGGGDRERTDDRDQTDDVDPDGGRDDGGERADAGIDWGPTAAETTVSEEAAVAARCPYCDRPFPDVRGRNLHVGEAHDDRCTDAEREAYEEALEAERDDLFVYHLKAVVLIGLTWAAVVLLYMVALGSGII